jgi:hypothetical protein
MIDKFSQSSDSTWDSIESEEALKGYNPSSNLNLSRFLNQSVILKSNGSENYNVRFSNQNEVSSILIGILLRYMISPQMHVYISLLSIMLI